MKIVSVEWIDARMFLDNMDEREILELEPKICETVGYLVVDDDKNVKIAGQIYQTDEWDNKICYTDINVIPKCLVRKIRVFKENKN
jgi:hypothetical protein